MFATLKVSFNLCRVDFTYRNWLYQVKHSTHEWITGNSLLIVLTHRDYLSTKNLPYRYLMIFWTLNAKLHAYINAINIYIC